MADEEELPPEAAPAPEEPPIQPATINVIATATGALPVKGLVHPGDRFAIAPELFSATWMKPADGAASKALKALAKKSGA